MRTGSIVAHTSFVLVLGMAALAACGHPAPHSAAVPAKDATESTPAAAAGPIEVRIESHNSSDVIVYVARGRIRQRLGTVTGSSTRTLSIPGRIAADPGGFYLIAHRVGGASGSDVSSPTVTVLPGQTVVWTLESDLEHSALSVN